MEDGSQYGICKLRTARTLAAGMVLTVEPGIYFIGALIDKALADPVMSALVDADALHAFQREVGGVRLEDVVVVTEGGCRNLTLCPRTVDEVEAVRSGGAWPPEEDAAPELKRAWGGL